VRFLLTCLPSPDVSVSKSPRRGFRALLVALLLAVGVPGVAQAQLGWTDVFDFWRNGRTFYLPMTDGQWSFQSDSIPTFTLEFHGTVTIKAPATGTFHVLILDLERPTADGYTTVLDAEVLPNQDIPFTYDTGSHVRLRMRVEWSEGEQVPRSELAVHVSMG
jgi:hypothetical protein